MWLSVFPRGTGTGQGGAGRGGGCVDVMHTQKRELGAPTWRDAGPATKLGTRRKLLLLPQRGKSCQEKHCPVPTLLQVAASTGSLCAARDPQGREEITAEHPGISSSLYGPF